MNKEEMRKRMEGYALSQFGSTLQCCTDKEKFIALAKAVMEMIVPAWIESRQKFQGQRQAYYFSAEYLLGRALSNNLINLQCKKEVEEMLAELGVDYSAIAEAEEDAGLGSGGLGRLAACFLDSAATMDLPLNGYGLRYEYGIFKQSIADGCQVEAGDKWLEHGDPWSVRRSVEAVRVRFADGEVLAVPYDTPIVGYGASTVNTLRLWQAEALNDFDFASFNQQQYLRSVEDKIKAETISRVLYPNDSGDEGKKLRLKQQYFFVSASLQDLVNKHRARHPSLKNFSKLHSIQLNDTHPAVAIAELMRILTQEEHLPWDKAWAITVETFAYTNHTLLAEAMEQWPIHLFKALLPSVYEIIVRIDRQLAAELRQRGIEERELSRYQIIASDSIRMAWLSIYGSSSTNGVAKLHTEIMTKAELRHWHQLFPGRFNNKTNGITQRRWLLQSNPELAGFITELLGSDSWVTDLAQLKRLEQFADDEGVLAKFHGIKQKKKTQLAEYVYRNEGIAIDPDSIFDIQIKRLHEYKRQLLLAFFILDLYNRLREQPELDIWPRTFIFGGKAAPGYFRAKAIIKFINEVKDRVNNDDAVNRKMKVVFVQNYRVSYAEKLFPAADISEQISTAGKEASGTGNMKFMLNGAPTIGTYDGANVEIAAEAGAENNFIFGLRVEEIAAINDTYDPAEECAKTAGLQKVVDALVDGTFSDGGSGMFRELHDSLFKGAHWHRPDPYYVLKDFASYRDAQARVDAAYKNRLAWARSCWLNLANAGKFSSDRTVRQYAAEIWRIDSKG